MKSELRFLLAIFLMLGVLVGTNLLFPPVPPPEATAGGDTTLTGAGASRAGKAPIVEGPGETDAAADAPEETARERLVTVEGPLYRFTFSNLGARLVSAEMLDFRSFRRDGPVNLVPEGAPGYLGHKVVVGSDTLDLTGVPFEVEPAGGVRVAEGGGARSLTFRYRHPRSRFALEVAYDFHPATYAVSVRGRVAGVDRSLLVTDLGHGLSFEEADSAGESRSMAYVANRAANGIASWSQAENAPRVVEGPLLWAAFRSKFFVLALLAGEDEAAPASSYLGGMLVAPSPLDERSQVQVAQTPGPDGAFAYRLFAGPQEYARLSSLGEDMEEVNPYGWRFFRPIIRPFVSIIIAVLTFLHDQLNIGYGWVLVIFGVMMRVVLWPLNHKAMRAQLRNMAAQPLLKDIQERYKDNPEKLRTEMMKLYKEHGFNPAAGCVPMLLPWPVLIALFFVFQNAIELRGVPFFWIPDLSAPDPLYLLPAFLAISMFVMQLVSYKALDQPNPQMKMMMYIMPPMMAFIFLNLASGLNLYYATANVATIPQQIWINRERRKMHARGTVPQGGAKR